MVLPEALLKILVCPVDKGCLLYFADEDLLYNPRLRRGYRIEQGVPAMLAERAEPVTDHEHQRLLSRARDGAAGLSAAGLAGQLPGGREERRLASAPSAPVSGFPCTPPAIPRKAASSRHRRDESQVGNFCTHSFSVPRSRSRKM